MIYHITTAKEWRNALELGAYTADSLLTQGFIHCSAAAQVGPVANRFFNGASGLVLLEIDPEALPVEIRWENLEGGVEFFPHIYGPINLEAVIRVMDFSPAADGMFSFPPGQ